jgi:hypothetical protein
MRKLRLIEHISLDGVIQHSADENGFPYDAWTTPYRTTVGRDAVLATHGDSFDLLLGMGKRVFAEGAPAQKFELVRTTTTPTGVLVNTYKVAGELTVE